MSFSTDLKEACIVTHYSGATDKQSILREIAKVAKKDALLDNISEETIFQSLQKREDSSSTGMEHGIAIPHCAIEGLTDFVIGIITVPTGVDFAALDGKETNIIVFILAPADKRSEHIRHLAIIARVLHSEEKRAEIISAKEAAFVRQAFLTRHHEHTMAQTKTESYLFTVIIQDADIFDDILELFTNIEGGSVSVTEAKDATDYLNALPLFHSFITEERAGYHRIILATLTEQYLNETTYELNSFIEKRSGAPGLLFFVQKLNYLNGNIDL
ncbi:PTS sugar transporter subunit IIA [bacterium]|nr:PTS sugar transporter subunit IIA [bacterium]